MSDAKPKAPAKVNPMALSPVDLARMLTAAGGQAVTAEMVEKDIAAGAPVARDGTVNLVAYAAWLVKEATRGQR